MSGTGLRRPIGVWTVGVHLENTRQDADLRRGQASPSRMGEFVPQELGFAGRVTWLDKCFDIFPLAWIMDFRWVGAAADYRILIGLLSSPVWLAIAMGGVSKPGRL